MDRDESPDHEDPSLDEQDTPRSDRWSASANDDLIEELQAKYERRLKEARRHQEELEEELDAAREQGRNERRKLTEEIQQLEEEIEEAKEEARKQVNDDLRASVQFQLQEALLAKKQAEDDYGNAHAKWELERNTLKAQLASIQASALEAMERSNNPTRLTMAVREQVDARLKAARLDWEIEAEGERRRLTAEIERLKKAANVDEKREAAKRLVLQRLGKLPPDGSVQKTAEQWAREFEESRIAWETERDHLKLKLEQLERENTRGRDEVRNEAFQELTLQYEPKLRAAEEARGRLQAELDSITAEMRDEHQRLTARIEHLEGVMEEAQEAARLQATAEVRDELEPKLEELNRLKARNERRLQDSVDDLEAELRRCKKQVTQLEEELREAGAGAEDSSDSDSSYRSRRRDGADDEDDDDDDDDDRDASGREDTLEKYRTDREDAE